MADLLIKGLKMPNSCQTCVYELGYNIPMCPDDAILENYLEDERLGRHPSCPLVALPEHGRLIEENKAYDSIAEEATDHCIDMDAVGKGLECTPTVLEASTEELTDEQIYQLQSSERDYCERYEPTYNPEDGSM